MMLRSTWLLVAASLCLSTGVALRMARRQNTTSPAHRVVGYIPTYREYALDSFDYSALTHVIAAFLEPGRDGGFDASASLQRIVSHSKAKGVPTLVAIGGGIADVEDWLTHMSSDNAQATADKIVQATLNLGADGIDVDLEGELVLASSYNGFCATLAAAAKAHDLIFTAALAKWTTSQAITDHTLGLFDFVNLMVYDYKGPWDTAPPLQHSSYAMAQNEMDYHMISRGLPGNRIALGVPFYGWDFSNASQVTAFTWSQVVANHPEHLDDDDFDGMYYNGKKTIRDKVALAKSLGAGIMIWELGQDAPPGEHSLLRQIKEAMAA